MKGSSIFRVWDSESEQVLESHNCFVDENIIAYENLANIKVHSKKKTTSTSNHAVNSSSVSSLLLSQPSFVSEKVSASATLLLQFLLLQWSNSVSMHSSSSSVLEKAWSEKASTSSCCQFELTGSNLQVLNKLSDSDELGSLNPSASAVGSLNPSASAAASHYNLHNCSVNLMHTFHMCMLQFLLTTLLNWPHISRLWSHLCVTNERWLWRMKSSHWRIITHETLSMCCQISMSLKDTGFTRLSVTLMIRLTIIRLAELSKATNSSLT